MAHIFRGIYAVVSISILLLLVTATAAVVIDFIRAKVVVRCCRYHSLLIFLHWRRTIFHAIVWKYVACCHPSIMCSIIIFQTILSIVMDRNCPLQKLIIFTQIFLLLYTWSTPINEITEILKCLLWLPFSCCYNLPMQGIDVNVSLCIVPAHGEKEKKNR